jgi:hypothetical protein
MEPVASRADPSTGVVGRDHERAVLLQVLEEDGPLLAFVHGPPGIGKSALLRTFASEASDADAEVIALDCRAFEPTQHGLLQALNDVLEPSVRDVNEAVSALEGRGNLVVWVLDTYEVFRISDSWLRSVFLPSLGDHVRVVIAGREPPLTGWFDARGSPDTFRSVLLGPLGDDETLQVLRGAGLTDPDARAINRVARGHPLALQIATAALRERPNLRVHDMAVPRVVEELTRLYFDHLDAPTRRVLEAAAVVRRATAPVMTAMLPDIPSRTAFEHLSLLPFVDESADGLRVHETIQEVVATRLRAQDPQMYRRYRTAAWRALRREMGEASRSELWRYSADILYLLENPAIREAFFPTTAHLYGVESARPDDGAAILDIIQRHEPPASASVLAEWWRTIPAAFRVVRDRAGGVVGFVAIAEAGGVPLKIVRADPVVAAWREHLHRHPLPRAQRALFDRSELSRDHGTEPSPVQAATWLDIKRMYMEMRPHIGRLYSAEPYPVPHEEALAVLGFSFSGRPIHVGRAYSLAWLDFGPDSVDGWLGRLAEQELGVRREELLDEVNRELVLNGDRISLTPLEFGVLQHLLKHKGRALSRATLIKEVWGHKYFGGSNVVDVVVRSLRKKLAAGGSLSPRIETVRGVGYRLSG